MSAVSSVLWLDGISIGSCAQTQTPFDTSGLNVVRRATALVPGGVTAQINVVSAHPGLRVAKAYVLEGKSYDAVTVVHLVFQIRLDHGWIIGESALAHPSFGESSRQLGQLRLAYAGCRANQALIKIIEGCEHRCRPFRAPPQQYW